MNGGDVADCEPVNDAERVIQRRHCCRRRSILRKRREIKCNKIFNWSRVAPVSRSFNYSVISSSESKLSFFHLSSKLESSGIA